MALLHCQVKVQGIRAIRESEVGLMGLTGLTKRKILNLLSRANLRVALWKGYIHYFPYRNNFSRKNIGFLQQIFVKATVLLKKLLYIDLTKYFFGESWFLHTSVWNLFMNLFSMWEQVFKHENLLLVLIYVCHFHHHFHLTVIQIVNLLSLFDSSISYHFTNLSIIFDHLFNIFNNILSLSLYFFFFHNFS